MLTIGLSELDEVLRYAVVVITRADVDVVVVSAFAADAVDLYPVVSGRIAMKDTYWKYRKQ